MTAPVASDCRRRPADKADALLISLSYSFQLSIFLSHATDCFAENATKIHPRRPLESAVVQREPPKRNADVRPLADSDAASGASYK